MDNIVKRVIHNILRRLHIMFPFFSLTLENLWTCHDQSYDVRYRLDQRVTWYLSFQGTGTLCLMLSWSTHQPAALLFPVHYLRHMMYTYNLKTDNTTVCQSCTDLCKFPIDRAFRIIAAFNLYLTFLWLVIARSISTLKSWISVQCEALWMSVYSGVNSSDIATKVTCYLLGYFMR